MNYFNEYLHDYENKLIVYLKCPKEVLISREVLRGDRSPGLAEKQLKSIESYLGPDKIIDSHALSANEGALEVIKNIK